jgi:hypothetical protein
MMIKRIGRRRVLAGIISASGVLVLPSAGTAGEADLAEKALGLFGNRNDAIRLGMACQTQAGLLLSRQAIVNSIFGADRDRLAALDRPQVHDWLRARIQDDFNAGKTVTVEGWILADTEAKLYALSYQSRNTLTCGW